jgi:hypothetical protein
LTIPFHIRHRWILIAWEWETPSWPYSPDLALSYFWLSGTLKEKVERSTFGIQLKYYTCTCNCDFAFICVTPKFLTRNSSLFFSMDIR